MSVFFIAWNSHSNNEKFIEIVKRLKSSKDVNEKHAEH